MVWCNQCAMEVEVEVDDANGFSCCVQCGRVVEDTAFSSDVMFSKGADGEGELVGQMVGAGGEARGLGRFSGGRMWASGGDSHEAAVSRGRYEIVALVEALRISPSGEATDAAHRFYKLALQRGFTRGRRANQVAAVCLYIFCRLEKRPYMLIDFSDHLSVNVYTLGAVFLQMLRLLRLDENATFTKPIDPSLYMNRFVDRLRLPTQELKTKITNTAMRLVQSMKRDWMLVGRRPSGICGAALFLASHINGVEKTKKDVISIVHIGWSTVEKRVLELAETRDAELTLGQLGERDRVIEEEQEQLLLKYERAAAERPLPQLPAPPAAAAAAADGAAAVVDAGGGEGGAAAALVSSSPGGSQQQAATCEHVRAGAPVLAHGMCRGCLEEYLKITMAGPQGGAYDPPAYLRNLRRNVKTAVRSKFAASRKTKAITAAGELLALEGPPGTSPGAGSGGDELDFHERRHLENEAALEQEDADGDAAGPSTSAGRGAKGRKGRSGGVYAPEEEAEFVEALRSSELESLTKAVGGAVAAAAAEPLPRRRAAAAGTGGTGAYGGDGEDAAAVASSAAVEDEEAAAMASPAKRLRIGGEIEAALAASEGEEGDGAAAAVVPTDGGGEGLSSDNLSDVDDDAIEGYLATREEASVREALWTEMNKDWIEKQEAKKAAEAANGGADAARKRKYNRKPKAALPAAEDAAGATRNLLEAKKLSNKINYGALENLFGGPSGSDAAAVATTSYGAGAGGGGGGSRGASPGFDAIATAAAADDDGGEPAVAAALSKRAHARARDAVADSARYTAALEEEQRRRSNGLSGGFLDSLTFARGEGAAPGGRLRPAGLSLRGRGR